MNKINRPWAVLALLLVTMSACAMFHPIRLSPELPDVKKITVKAKVMLLKFEDARPRDKDWIPERIGQLDNHRFVFDKPMVEKVGGLIQDLLEKSGYLVLNDEPGKASEAGLVLSGKLEEMAANLRKEAFNPHAPLVCRIRLRLSLNKDGKLVAQKTLEVQHLRRGFSIMGIPSYTKVVNEAFEIFLEDAADFIESDDFSKASAR